MEQIQRAMWRRGSTDGLHHSRSEILLSAVVLGSVIPKRALKRTILRVPTRSMLGTLKDHWSQTRNRGGLGASLGGAVVRMPWKTTQLSCWESQGPAGSRL